MSRILDTVLGTATLQKIHKTNVLIVGVGGIGCQLLKAFSKSGFKKFTILDLDTIQQTNLNRQFYFRKHHIGKPKATVGRQSILRIDPTLQVTSIYDSIYKAEYDLAFFSQFDVIISALDNVKAREYLAKMSLKAGKHMVDAGTQAFSGQTRTTVRYYSQCQNCRPTEAEETFAVCTIRNRPQRPIHCVAYAKNFYNCFFGSDKTSNTRGDINLEQFIDGSFSNQEIQQVSKKVFNAVFCTRVAEKNTELLSKAQNGEMAEIRTLTFDLAMTMDQILTNPDSTYNQYQAQKQKISQYEQEKLWSIKRYAQKFVQSLKNILILQKKELGSLTFEKDDENCMMLVYCLTTLRTYNFMNRVSASNKHKYLTYFQVKDMAGKIVAAIASTNSIAASTQTLQIVKILKNEVTRLQYIVFNNSSQDKIIGMTLPRPNLSCYCCSYRNFYLWIACNFKNVTFGEIEDYLKDYYSYGRNLNARNTQGGMVTLTKDNKNRKLIDKTDIINSKGNIELQLQPIENQTEVFINVFLQNNQAEEKISLRSQQNKARLRKNMIRYLREKIKKIRPRQEYVYDEYGYL